MLTKVFDQHRKDGEKTTSDSTSPDPDIVLLCNPRAGGRWKELADILDSDEAHGVRRIVTDSIEDVGPALADLGKKTRLLCIYGGDGTIQRIIDKLYQFPPDTPMKLAFIGGGTMNVAASWCGYTKSPGKNFRALISAHESGDILFREVPLLEVRQGKHVYHGFTFGIGPIVRIMDRYEQGRKSKLRALGLAAKSVAAAWTKWPADFKPFLQEMDGEITVDGKRLPYDRYAAVFCNVTGMINPGVVPFVKTRKRETFFYGAYAVDRREFTMMMPMLTQGRLPMDPKSLLKPVSTWKQILMSLAGKGNFPVDPRYVNDIASEFEIHSPEEHYTVDGEILRSTGEPIKVTLGPMIELAVSPTVGLGTTMRLAADIAQR